MTHPGNVMSDAPMAARMTTAGVSWGNYTRTASWANYLEACCEGVKGLFQGLIINPHSCADERGCFATSWRGFG